MSRNNVLTETDRAIYELWKTADVERELLIVDALSIHEYDLEDKVREYLCNNPDATFMDVDEFIASLCPPLEIVDDDELDDEE